MGRIYKIYIIVMLSMLFNSVFASTQLSDNVMSCTYSSNSNLGGFSKVLSILSPSNSIENAHVSDKKYSASHYLYCKAEKDGKVYGSFSSEIMKKTNNKDCGGKYGYVKILDVTSDKNAHVGVNNNYEYEWCMKFNPSSGLSISPVLYCYISDTGSCMKNTICMFKFNGKSADNSGSISDNAHVYGCDYTNNYPNEYRTVCCGVDPKFSGNIIANVKEISKTSDNSLYVLVGETLSVPISLYNPLDVPQSISLTVNSDDEVFNHFIWLGDTADIYSESPNKKTIIVPSKSKVVLNLNIFGGKVGSFNLHVYGSTEEGGSEEIYSSKVVVIPYNTQGTMSSSPEGSIWYYVIGISSLFILLLR